MIHIPKSLYGDDPRNLLSCLQLIGVPSLYLKTTEYGQEKVTKGKDGSYSGLFSLSYLTEIVDWSGNKKSIFLTGGTGVGKTQLLIDYLVYRMEKGPMYSYSTIQFHTTSELLSKFRATKNFNNSFYVGAFGIEITNIADFIKIIKQGREIMCLILDDLQLDNLTAEDKQNLSLMINACYEGQLTLWITSNHTLKEVAEVLDSRIASRLVEMCRIFKMEGANRRLLDKDKVDE